MNSWLYLLQWTLMIAMLRMCCEMSVQPDLSLEYTSLTGDSQEPASLTPQQKEWAERAVRRYAEAQEKKWQHWRDNMFRPKS